MRTLIAALFLAFSSISLAMALSGATADSADRFPFVVEIKYQDRLICSGTVLFPRIVVTAAHCVQEKVHFRGGEFYADSYFLPADLTVTVTHHGGTETHAVADVAASPVWRALETDSSGQRFAHDLALIVTKEPIDVGLPPSFDKLADDETAGPQIVSVRPSDAAVTPRYEALRGVLETGLTHRGVLVAFGADKCSSLRQCGDAGIRRYLPISIKASADCFNDSRGRPRYPPLSPELTAVLPLAVWCMESNVMPGDSGGALLVEGTDGKLYYLGVISAQQGLFPEIWAGASERRSLATALYPSLGFIADRARKLGYEP
jgi:hypothetical protein